MTQIGMIPRLGHTVRVVSKKEVKDLTNSKFDVGREASEEIGSVEKTLMITMPPSLDNSQKKNQKWPHLPPHQRQLSENLLSSLETLRLQFLQNNMTKSKLLQIKKQLENITTYDKSHPLIQDILVRVMVELAKMERLSPQKL